MVAADGAPYPGDDSVHIVFHQQTVETNPLPGLVAVSSVLDTRSLRGPADRGSFRDSISGMSFTVAEVVVSKKFKRFDEEVADADEDESRRFHEAFTYAISRLNETLSALALIQNTLVPKVTLESLPPLLTAASGAFEPWELQGQELPKVRPEVVQLVNGNLFSLAAPPPIENLDGFLGSALASVSEKGPFSSYADLRREATHYHRVAGDYRVAIILYASACESYFDELLQHLLWEGGLNPREAAVEFSQNGKAPKRGKKFRNEGITNLVKERLVPLLSGQTELPKALERWIEKVSEVRNMVIHNGYAPTAEDLGACADTFAEVDSYLADQVCKRRRDYPITALALLGKSGLESRGGWSPDFSKLETHLINIYERIRVFARWRAHLSAMRKDYSDFETTASPVNASSVLAFHPDTGKEAVFAVHPNGTLATELPLEPAKDTKQYSMLRTAAHTRISVFAATLGDLSIPRGSVWDRLVYEIPGTPACMFSHLKEVRGW
ncbi:hypothetical protein [Corynebacterium nasicanis]